MPQQSICVCESVSFAKSKQQLTFLVFVHKNFFVWTKLYFYQVLNNHFLNQQMNLRPNYI